MVKIVSMGRGVTALSLLLASFNSALAMQPCPPRSERFANAEIVVEARAKSVFTGQAGLTQKGRKAGIVKAELEVVRVIKGQFGEKDVIVYDSAYDAALGPLRPLVVMAALYGLGEGDSFEIELLNQELGSLAVSFLSFSSCGYWKFPDEIDPETAPDAR